MIIPEEPSIHELQQIAFEQITERCATPQFEELRKLQVLFSELPQQPSGAIWRLLADEIMLSLALAASYGVDMDSEIRRSNQHRTEGCPTSCLTKKAGVFQIRNTHDDKRTVAG